jgi:hypothetical protein
MNDQNAPGGKGQVNTMKKSGKFSGFELIAAVFLVVILAIGQSLAAEGNLGSEGSILLAMKSDNTAGQAAIEATNPPSATNQQKKRVFGDGGSDGMVDPGVDLVVSKVVITKGTFAGTVKIQIKPYIKNMWRGRTAHRIKISFHGLEAAIWLEGGIGPNEEKMGGAYYLPFDPAHNKPVKFSVEVDQDRAIPENNDGNNKCGPVIFDPMREHYKLHTCPITGPHEPLI